MTFRLALRSFAAQPVRTLVLAGIIFFFAYNWANMGRFLKFGVIEQLGNANNTVHRRA